MTGNRFISIMKKHFFTIFIIALMASWGNNAGGSIPGEIKKKNFCNEVNDRFAGFGWRNVSCNPDQWKIFDYTVKGNPLFYEEFGFRDSNSESPVNLLLCGVHGDEHSGIYICFQLVKEILTENPGVFGDLKLVIAPIVNPDGFFANTRENANGVDPNRNLPTKDWDGAAQKVWNRYNGDPRKYPGAESGTETESKLQMYLINKYNPDKIISIHAPLGFLDFDGPGDQKYRNLIRLEKRAKYLGLNIEANSKKLLKLVDFRFFPGSLGNYAGNERSIPTYTIELPSSDAAAARGYWSDLKFALLKALSFKVDDRNERRPFYSDDTMAFQAAHAEPEPVVAAASTSLPDHPSRAVMKLNFQQSNKALIAAGLLVMFVTFQLVMLQGKSHVVSAEYPVNQIHNRSDEPDGAETACTLTENPDSSGIPRYLSTTERDELVDACEAHLKPIVLCALNTGMLKREILNLTWGDVDLEHGCIVLDRTRKSERVIPINDILQRTLAGVPKHHDVPYVFYNPRTRKPYRNISKSFSKALMKSRAGNLHFRELRHTFAYNLIMEGNEIQHVIKLLGHATANTVSRYSQIAESLKT